MAPANLSCSRSRPPLLSPISRAFSFFLATLLLFPLLAPAAGTDDEDAIRIPGVLATYEIARGGQPILRRFEATPALRLNAGEAPDPRLPATGWRALWTGVIDVKSPGQHRFFGRASGPFTLTVAGKKVLEGAGKPGDDFVRSEPIRLDFALHKFELRFEPRADSASTFLNLFWESEEFRREPLSPMVLGHTAEQGALEDPFPIGRLLVEEHNCIACHRPAAQDQFGSQLLSRPGPKLADMGTRVRAGWIARWLDNPQSVRPEAVMPRLFPDGRAGEVQRWAVATLLTGKKSPPLPRKLDEKLISQWTKEGAETFERTGCIVCHAGQGRTPPRVTLQHLADKTTTTGLSKFIANPAETHVSGRMPQFAFPREQDHYRLALYLTSRPADLAANQPQLDFHLPATPTEDELRTAANSLALSHGPAGNAAAARAAIATLNGDELIEAVARKAILAYRCAACHEIRLGSDPAPLTKKFAKHSWSEILRNPQVGCLIDPAQPPVADVPRFGPALHREKKNVTAFLVQSITVPGTAAPGESARLMMERLNCLGCHQRNGAGGLSTEIVHRLLAVQTEQNAEAVSPPPLTGLAGKLRVSALRGVLEAHERARPWMGLQMPRFEKSLIAKIPEGIAALDGDSLDDEKFRPAADPQFIEAGRTLTGDKGFSCIKCHDMLGIPNAGTRGPDLASTVERVRHDWFTRWIIDPQRLQPGTRMPSVFYDNGKRSAYTEILGGDPDKQRLALWQYLLVCRNLPAPQGLVVQKVLRVPDRDLVNAFRTFLPDISARGIAVRHQSGVHVAFDAQACRLAYAWAGEFLEMSPVWTGRGGRPARLEGPRFWESPPGFPWAVTSSSETVPDLVARGDDRQFGANLPDDGRVHPSVLQFRSYEVLGDRTRFTYRWNTGDKSPIQFQETVGVSRSPLSTGVYRALQATLPADEKLWLHVSLSDRPPEWHAADGRTGRLEQPRDEAPGNTVILVWQSGRPIVLRFRAVTDGTWRAAHQGQTWSLFLTQPRQKSPKRQPAPATQTISWGLNALRPIDDQEATARKLIAEELKP